MEDSLTKFLFPALMLFATGLLGAMFKRNLIIIFMCVELMLCGARLAMLAFASEYGDIRGGVFAFFVMTIAAAEVAVGLAVITRLFVVDGTISTKNMNTLGD